MQGFNFGAILGHKGGICFCVVVLFAVYVPGMIENICPWRQYVSSLDDAAMYDVCAEWCMLILHAYIFMYIVLMSPPVWLAHNVPFIHGLAAGRQAETPKRYEMPSSCAARMG